MSLKHKVFVLCQALQFIFNQKTFKMKSKIIVFILLLSNLLLTISCSGNREILKETRQVNKQIDDYISTLIKADKIPGLAIAVIQKGEIIHKKNYGLANLVHRVPVTDNTLFRA